MKTRKPLAWRQLGLMTLAVATFGLMTACNDDKPGARPPVSIADTTCLWRGPISTTPPNLAATQPVRNSCEHRVPAWTMKSMIPNARI